MEGDGLFIMRSKTKVRPNTVVVGHDHRLMAAAAAEILYEEKSH